jgi:hypothetical protein
MITSAKIKACAVALAVVLSMPGAASAQQGPFAPTELSYEEAWKLACWDKAEFQMVANDCTQGGRYMLDSSGKYSRWTDAWMRDVDAAVPGKIAQVRASSANTAARQNMAYRVLIARNMSHDDAVVICKDLSAVNAIINGVAGLEPAPGVVIEDRRK